MTMRFCCELEMMAPLLQCEGPAARTMLALNTSEQEKDLGEQPANM